MEYKKSFNTLALKILPSLDEKLKATYLLCNIFFPNKVLLDKVLQVSHTSFAETCELHEITRYRKQTGLLFIYQWILLHIHLPHCIPSLWERHERWSLCRWFCIKSYKSYFRRYFLRHIQGPDQWKILYSLWGIYSHLCCSLQVP